MIESFPLVSVVIPFFNGEEFLGEAIASVASQTYPNLELLLVDDGSTDSSSAIALEYARLHPNKVRYLEHDGHRNRGPAAARNLGIHHANGALLAFLDCDDVWLPRKIEEQVAILNRYQDVGMVFGASEYWQSWAEPGTDAVPDVGFPADTIVRPPDLLSLLHPLGEKAAPCPSDLLIRREALNAIGGFEEEFRGPYRVYEDQAFLAKVYLHETVFVSVTTWTRYRVHSGSCMATADNAGYFPIARSFFLDFLERYLKAEGIKDPGILGLLRKAQAQMGRPISIEGLGEADLRELKWRLRVANGNHAALEFPRDDRQLLRLSISSLKTQDPWDIQLNQSDLAVKCGHTCRISFRARASEARGIGLGFSRAHAPWDSLGLYRRIDLTPEWQDHDFEFVVTSDDRNARVHFDAGGSQSQVELSDVTVYNQTENRLIEPDFILHGLYPAERRAETRSEAGRENQPAASARSAPQISVIIPTYQRRDLAVRTVSAFARQELNGCFEVIVVVDGSRDGTAEALRALNLPFPLIVLEQANRGASAARNRGAGEARADVLLFLDDDMEPHPMLLAEHLRSHAAGAEVVSGHFPLHPESPAHFLSAVVKAWAEERARALSQPGADVPFSELLTGQISVRREIFHAVGGFDTDFTRGGTYGAEDMELGYRLIAGGYRAVFNPYALSYQYYVVTPRQHLRQIRMAGRANVEFAQKHPDLAGAIFSWHAKGRLVKAGVWRRLAATRPWSIPLSWGLRSLLLGLIERGMDGPRTSRFFFEIFEMEFWRGVHDAGGMPRLGSVRVLAYHAIRDLAGAPVAEPYGTPPNLFRKQMELLKRAGFSFIDAGQFLRFVRSGGPLPRRPVLITFDDCYEDLRDHALPVLRSLGIPAVAFAVSGRTGLSNTWDEEAGAPPMRLLDDHGLKELAAAGVEIGAHSRTHRKLTELPPEELKEEVGGCVQDLETRGLRRPRFFAYPYGLWNPAARQAAREAGLDAAFTVDYGKALEGTDAWSIPRIEILRGDTGWKFLRKIINAV